MAQGLRRCERGRLNRYHVVTGWRGRRGDELPAGGGIKVARSRSKPYQLSSQSGGYNPWAARAERFDPSIGIAPRPLKNFANQVKAPAIDALLENAIITASWRDGDGGVCYIIPRVVRLERATCAASGFGGGLLVLPGLPHSTPDRHAVVRPCTPLALYSHRYKALLLRGLAACR